MKTALDKGFFIPYIGEVMKTFPCSSVWLERQFVKLNVVGSSPAGGAILRSRYETSNAAG